MACRQGDPQVDEPKVEEDRLQTAAGEPGDSDDGQGSVIGGAEELREDAVASDEPADPAEI